MVNKITLAIRGGKWKILWPNREGEIFSLSKVSHVLSQYNVPEGLTLSYPATASCRTLIFTEESGKGFAFLAPPDVKGRVTEFRIKAEDSQSGSISILGISCPWYSLVFDDMDELKDKVRDLQDSVPWTKLPFRKTNSKWQVQVGLIGPEGDTNVPENRGFNVLCDVSELMQKELGENNLENYTSNQALDEYSQ